MGVPQGVSLIVIVLVMEMTGSSSLLLPAIFASFSALMAASLIYDALRDRTIGVKAHLRRARQ